MIRTMDELLAAVAGEKRTVAVAAAHDADALRAVYAAHRAGIADAILIGDAEQIGRIAADSGIPIGAFQILHEPDNAGACEKAAALVREGAAGALMKGLVETAVILRAVLDREKGIRAAPLLSHVALLEISGFGRPLLLTDAAMNIAPDLEAKKQLLQNAALVARALGNPAPVAACLCASEKTNPKMPATLDAAALSEAARRGELPGCRVFGPAALDNAVFPEAAKHKGITDPLAGYADILLDGYENIFDPVRQEQFAALTLHLPDGSAAVAFRGTDGTLVGWKEDFNMAFSTVVPAQLDAVRYLSDVAEARTWL